MNKEYVRVDENLLAVYDEEGNVDYRNYCEQMPDVLVLENNLDYIYNVIDNLKKKLLYAEQFLNFKKIWNKLQMIQIPIIIVIGMISTVISSMAIYLMYAIICSLACGLSIVIASLLSKIHEKKYNGIAKQLIAAEEIKEKWSQELREITKVEIEDKVVQNKKYVVPMNTYEIENKKIQDAYYIGYNQSKSKVRTRKLINK